MSGISDTINSAKTSVIGFADDLSGALDFGAGAPPPQPVSQTRNPEIDVQEIDRTNPTNVNFPLLGGLPPYVLYGALAIVALVVVKKVL